MAQNVTVAGASYPDVPAVELPKTGGGTATFTDITDTTADASDVADGEVFYNSGGTRSIGTGKYASSPVANGNAKKTNAILYGVVDGTSTSTAFTATVDGLTEYVDGTTIMLKNGVVTSAAGFTINVNGIGAKPAYNNMAAATAETTIFNVNYTMMFVYDSTRIAGGAWICYRGYDANTNTIAYQVRTNSSSKVAQDKGYKYRIWFTSADGQKWVPANKSSSTNATATRTTNTTPIDPFGEIVYCSYNGTTNAGAVLSASSNWFLYTVTFGYSFNNTGSALTMETNKPVYLRCAPQSNGSAVMEYFTQALPSTEDGKIYIFLGVAYSATNIELMLNHPVYYYKNGAIRLWSNAETLPTLATVATTGDYNDLTNKPTIPTPLPAVTSADNGKFLVVDNGAWTAQTVPNANGNSF